MHAHAYVYNADVRAHTHAHTHTYTHTHVILIICTYYIYIIKGGCHSDPCMNGGMCNTIGPGVDQYRCSCPVGFTGVNCEIEIDHCSDEPCRFQGWCTSDPTGFTCTCLHGFTGKSINNMFCHTWLCAVCRYGLWPTIINV